MSSRAYQLLGWAVWQIAMRSVRKSLAENKTKLGAGATVLLVLIGGLLAARATGGED
jgi:hypothetical protein